MIPNYLLRDAAEVVYFIEFNKRQVTGWNSRMDPIKTIITIDSPVQNDDGVNVTLHTYLGHPGSVVEHDDVSFLNDGRVLFRGKDVMKDNPEDYPDWVQKNMEYFRETYWDKYMGPNALSEEEIETEKQEYFESKRKDSGKSKESTEVTKDRDDLKEDRIFIAFFKNKETGKSLLRGPFTNSNDKKYYVSNYKDNQRVILPGGLIKEMPGDKGYYIAGDRDFTDSFDLNISRFDKDEKQWKKTGTISLTDYANYRKDEDKAYSMKKLKAAKSAANDVDVSYSDSNAVDTDTPEI